MSLPVPTHLVDTMGSATAAGVEAAGHLLHDVGNAVNNAASATTGKYRKLARSVHDGRKSEPNHVGRNLLLLVAIAGLAAVAVLARRSKASPSATTLPGASNDDAPSADKGRAANVNGQSSKGKGREPSEAVASASDAPATQ